MKIKHRDVMIGESYCSSCNEAIDALKLITLKDDQGEYQACPHCHEVFEGWYIL